MKISPRKIKSSGNRIGKIDVVKRMKMEEQNKNKGYDFKKPILLLDTMVYPYKLYDILCKVVKENGGIFCKNSVIREHDFVRALVIVDIQEDKLDEATKQVTSLFWEDMEAQVIIWDDEEFINECNRIKKQIENGIDEKNFYDWFFKLMVNIQQNKIPMNDDGSNKEGHNPGSILFSYTYQNGLHENIILISTCSKMFNEATTKGLLDKINKEVKELISDKPKKIQKRNPIESRLRHEVFKRDGFRCKECGKTNKEAILHCDHIISVAQGGSDELDNLQTLCDACNLAKSDKVFKNG